MSTPESLVMRGVGSARNSMGQVGVQLPQGRATPVFVNAFTVLVRHLVMARWGPDADVTPKITLVRIRPRPQLGAPRLPLPRITEAFMTVSKCAFIGILHALPRVTPVFRAAPN